jgi:hypothetical protein
LGFHRIELEKAASEQKHAMKLMQLEADCEQRFELEKEDRQRQHEIMLQKMQMELQLADVMIRLANIADQSSKKR